MNKRKPTDKDQLRQRRNQLLESASSGELLLNEGVREMRAISGMTQEEFARHRGVSARVIKALELGQANPTMATMNRIGDFFGLEVGFVPARRSSQAAKRLAHSGDNTVTSNDSKSAERETMRFAIEATEILAANLRKLDQKIVEMKSEIEDFIEQKKIPNSGVTLQIEPPKLKRSEPDDKSKIDAETRSRKKQHQSQ